MVPGLSCGFAEERVQMFGARQGLVKATEERMEDILGWMASPQNPYTRVPRFIAFCFAVLHRHCVLINAEARPSTRRKGRGSPKVCDG